MTTMELSPVEPLCIYTMQGNRATSFLGSGFFIANGWVATCEHVVHNALDGHELVVQHPQLDIAWKSQEVRFHKRLDLAFIRLDVQSNFLPIIEVDPMPGMYVISKGLHDEVLRDGKVHAKMRLLRGHITSVMDDPNRLRTGKPYLELSYPILCGFSGTALLVDMENAGYGIFGMGFGNAEQQIVTEHEVLVEAGTERKVLRVIEFGIAHSASFLAKTMRDLDIK